MTIAVYTGPYPPRRAAHIIVLILPVAGVVAHVVLELGSCCRDLRLASSTVICVAISTPMSSMHLVQKDSTAVVLVGC